MRGAGLAAVLAIACSGEDPREYGYFDLSQAPFNLEQAVAGVGLPCSSGRDCAGGLACTNLLSPEQSECEMQMEPPCPTGLQSLLSFGAEPGGHPSRNGYFCVRSCQVGTDCSHGQCCLGLTAVPAWCVYDWPPRWPTTPLLCN